MTRYIRIYCTLRVLVVFVIVAAGSPVDKFLCNEQEIKLSLFTVVGEQSGEMAFKVVLKLDSAVTLTEHIFSYKPHLNCTLN